MPKYYCDYCDTYLTHDSPSVRKTHCTGRKHKDNVKFYYQKWMEQQVSSLKTIHFPFPNILTSLDCSCIRSLTETRLSRPNI